MAIGDPKPQTERVRQLIVIGDLEQLKGVMDVEGSLWHDRTFRDLRPGGMVLLGPVMHGASIIWVVPSGEEPALFPDRDSTEPITISHGAKTLSVSPDMTLQQIYDRAIQERFDLYRALRLGLLRASPLPVGRLRLLFAAAGFINPSLFWRWVADLTAELHCLGFQPTASLDEPLPPADEPEPLESSRSGWLATKGSGDGQVAAGAKPWMQIPDVGWHRRALELWWRGYTVTEIAAMLDRRPKTIGNRLSDLRRTHGLDIVPTAGRLRTLNIK
jgi:hypothetical protein